MNTEKPTREQVDAALRLMRHWWPLPPDPLTDTPQRQFAEVIDRMLGTGMLGAIRTLMAYASPDPGPPRPSSLVELAQQVADELCDRGFIARRNGDAVLMWLPGLHNEHGDCYLCGKLNGSPREYPNVGMCLRNFAINGSDLHFDYADMNAKQIADRVQAWQVDTAKSAHVTYLSDAIQARKAAELEGNK